MQKSSSENFLIDTDSYKMSHYAQYPPQTNLVHSYLESRGGRYDYTLFFGLQYILKEYLQGVVFNEDDIVDAAEFCRAHGVPFHEDGWRHILKEHNGALPLSIHAVHEGTIVPTHHALMTIENTDPHVAWLTSWIETKLLRIWYPVTVATLSHRIKSIIHHYLSITDSQALSSLRFRLHDFGSRGVSSRESAGIGGMSHLVNFSGSDTMVGIDYANRYYGSTTFPAFSVPAAEHSTITMWGEQNEVAAYQNMIDVYGEGIYSVVSDSYDLYNAISHIWGEVLHDNVVNAKGTLVIRPDSGDPADVVLRSLDLIEEKFGSYHSREGYKILNDKVRLIQGDGVNDESIHEILRRMMANGWSAQNITFGMGGALLQRVDRDTQRFAIKASYGEIDGRGQDVYKTPKTDAVKASKRGRQSLWRNNETGDYQTLPLSGGMNVPASSTSCMVEVFRNGTILVDQTFDEVRLKADGEYDRYLIAGE